MPAFLCSHFCTAGPDRSAFPQTRRLADGIVKVAKTASLSRQLQWIGESGSLQYYVQLDGGLNAVRHQNSMLTFLGGRKQAIVTLGITQDERRNLSNSGLQLYNRKY